MSKSLYFTEQVLEDRMNQVDIQPYDTGSYVDPITFKAMYHALPAAPGAGKVPPAGYHASFIDVSPEASPDKSTNVMLAAAALAAVVYMLYYRR